MSNFAGYDSMDERRKALLDSMKGGGSGRLLGTPPRHAVPLYGGLGRGHGGDYASAALPQLSFNPFLAQAKMGLQNIQGPTGDFVPPGLGGTPPGQMNAPSGPVSDATGGAPQAPQAPQAQQYAAQGQAGRIFLDRAVGTGGAPGPDPSALDAPDQFAGLTGAGATNPYLRHFLFQQSFGAGG